MAWMTQSSADTSCFGRTVRRIVDSVVALTQLVETLHVGTHVAVRREHDRR